MPRTADGTFMDYPQDAIKEVNRLAEALTRFHQVYGHTAERIQRDPKNAYLWFARRWDGLDLIAIQEELDAAREAVESLIGEDDPLA